MNVTPEVLERLRRLASLVSKKGNTRKSGEENKKEFDQSGNEHNKVNDAATGESLSEASGRLSPVWNGAKKDVTTLGNKLPKDEGEIKMDMDVFRQILKEVIIKRTFAIEKRLMGDFEALKKQVSDLEVEKKRLQCCSERLQQTLNEFSSKQEKQKVQMISCGTQVDMDLEQERALSPEISKPIKPTSMPGKSVHANKMQHSKIVNCHQAITVDSEQVVTLEVNVNTESLEGVKMDDRTRSSESKPTGNNTAIITSQNAPVATQDAAKTPKQGVIEVSIRPPSQGQQIAGESLLTRDQQSGLHVRDYHLAETPSPLPTHRPPTEFRVEVSRAGNEPVNVYQQPRRPGMFQNTQSRGPPPLRPRVPEATSVNSPITGQYQRNYPQMPTESPQPRRPHFSSSKWMSPQAQPPTQQVQSLRASGPSGVQFQPRISVNHGPLHPANRGSIAANPRCPPNVSLFQPTKRRRVDERSGSDGLHMHVVSSNSNYVMHNFKVNKSPWASGGDRGRQNVQISGSLLGKQALYTASPSNQPRGTYLSQSAPNILPAAYPDQHRFHAPEKAPDRPPAGIGQGQLVERVFYPSTGPAPGGSEHHNSQRVMEAQHGRSTEKLNANNQPAEPNGTIYVVQEYQVPRNKSAPLQPIAPAPPAVPRNPTYPPVQSPGISSTGYPPGDPNACSVPRSVANQDTTVVVHDHPQTQLKSPPKPTASIVVVQDGIVLSWNMQLDDKTAKIENYELFACQDGAESTTPPIMWKKIGIVKALPLPMACTLTQFSSGNKYHFAVRAVDDQERAGPFSDPCTISLTT